MEQKNISESLKKRIPLFHDDWMELFLKIRNHPHAPRWNTECGDRLTQDDMSFVQKFADNLIKRESFTGTPPEKLIRWILKIKPSTEWFRQKISSDNIADIWEDITPMTRTDMQSHIELIVPENADLDHLVVNPTSGTSGHPIPAPNHPCAVGCYDPIIQYALSRHGVKIKYDKNMVAALQICCQKETITYHTVHSYLNGAGFAKINLSRDNWKSDHSAENFISALKPVFLSGDPFSFLEYKRMGISYKPKALLTTALHLESALRKELEEYFNCPVVDMYSLNETGPIAYSCPHDPSRFHILPHDIFVEIVDSNGRQTSDGTAGDIAVSGGRNPYLPLLRYITGDTASISYEDCICGEKTPSLINLQGRPMVLFRTPRGDVINSIDIGRLIREFPVYYFKFTQTKDYNCILKISSSSDFSQKKEESLKDKLKMLFNNQVEIIIERDLKQNSRKDIPFASELL